METEKIINQCVNQCGSEQVVGYELCSKCFGKSVRICTCDKTFIVDKPCTYTFGKKNGIVNLYTLPDPIPEFFYTHIHGNLYHILGCRGCKYNEQISVKDNLKTAIQTSIESCIFQKVEGIYEYLSDSLDSNFENYALSVGIFLGTPAKIEMVDKLSS